MNFYKFVTSFCDAPIMGEFSYVKYLPEEGKPGKWTPRVKNKRLCNRGYHFVDRENLISWANQRLFEVETDDPDILGSEGKYCADRIRLIREIEAWNRSTVIEAQINFILSHPGLNEYSFVVPALAFLDKSKSAQLSYETYLEASRPLRNAVKYVRRAVSEKFVPEETRRRSVCGAILEMMASESSWLSNSLCSFMATYTYYTESRGLRHSDIYVEEKAKYNAMLCKALNI